MSQLPTEIASLLIPLESDSLLVPNTNVAEIIPYSTPQEIEDAPEWCVGRIAWRDLFLPCVSLEAYNSGSVASRSASQRLAIFNTVGVSKKTHFFAILIQGIPRLIRISPEDVVEEASAECNDIEQTKVQINGEPATIPDLKKLESLLEKVI